MNQQKEQAKCPPAALGCLVDLVSAAFGATSGLGAKVDIDDIEQMVDALHALRPGFAEFEFFDGWVHLLRRDWASAEAVYRSLIERSVCIPSSKGMLLRCLKSSKTFGWQEEARKLADEYHDHEVGRLARVYLAGDDLQEAYAVARRTGHFVAPESARELEQGTAPSPAKVEPALTNDMLMSMQYIRI
jgi:type III secretion protein HrpB1